MPGRGLATTLFGLWTAVLISTAFAQTSCGVGRYVVGTTCYVCPAGQWENKLEH